MNKLRKYGIILTTIMTIFTSSLIVTKAASPTVQVSWTKQLAWDYPYSSSTRTALLYNLFINTTDTCTGTITIDFSSMSANDRQYIDSGRWYSEGCRVTYNSSTHKLTISINSQQFCTISCLTYGWTTYTGIDLSYTVSKNLTIDTDTELTTKLDDILNEFGDLNTYAESIKTDLHSLYLLIVDLTGDVQDINDHMTTVLTRMNTIITSLSNVNTGITTIQNLINTNTQALATILSAVNSIDTQIDTISWQTGTYTATVYSDYNNQTLSKSNVFYVPIDQTFFNRLINIRPFNINAVAYKFANVSNVEFFGTNGSNVYGPVECTYFTDLYQSSLNLYVFCSNVGSFNSSYDYYLKITYDTEIIVGTSSFPNFMNYITETDIEYWKLLQTFNQFQYQKEQLDLTQELIDIVSQLTSNNSTETTTNITNFNTNMELINNIENNLSVDFGTYESGFKNQNENNWVIDAQLYQGASKFKTVFTNMLGYCDFEGSMLSLILLCAVLLAILG